ncbi:MAG: KH domain-containing protein [Fusobacteria bacterium]|nr:KH domain-containing protein [Fusobacteriota bacterium]
MARELIIKAGSISELELSLKVNHNFDKESEIYEIISEDKASGLKKLFASKAIYLVSIRGKNEKNEVVKVVKKSEENKKVEVKPQIKEIKASSEEKTVILKESEGEKKFIEYAVLPISKELVTAKVSALFEATHLDVKVVEVEEVDGNYNVIIEGESQGLIIGAKGKTLYSFEYLVNQFFGLRYKKIFLNFEGFK